jgi:hypothetical protein
MWVVNKYFNDELVESYSSKWPKLAHKKFQEWHGEFFNSLKDKDILIEIRDGDSLIGEFTLDKREDGDD